jgi:hypothetical protein
MKKLFLIIWLTVTTVAWSHALIINEIMSNPTGDDGGREWIEIYNNSSSTVDISSLTVSIKGGSFVVVTPISGGVMLDPNGYAIIASTVSGTTKFLQDYPAFSGPLFRSSISLVNTGATSIEIKVGGVTVDSLMSYTAAKEGLTYSRINGTFATGSPTPGAENQAVVDDTNGQATTSTTNTSQTTIAQMSPPSADVILYTSPEKVVVAGAESTFSVFGLTRAGKSIDNMTYSWAYGDGGQGVGSTTIYRYAYPGRYILQVEGTNTYVIGSARSSIRVVAPEITITNISNGKYGSYIDIENPNDYDLDFSQWKLVIDGAVFPFPKNTLIGGNGITHLSGLAMGFANTVLSASSSIKIVFPNQEEVVRYKPQQELQKTIPQTSISNLSKIVSFASSTISQKVLSPASLLTKINTANSRTRISSTGTPTTTPTSTIKSMPTKNSVITHQKDTRIVSFFKSLF